MSAFRQGSWRSTPDGPAAVVAFRTRCLPARVTKMAPAARNGLTVKTRKTYHKI